MASLSKDKSGWRVRYSDPGTTKRITIRLGQATAKNAQVTNNMIERLVEAKRLGQPLDGPTAEWLKKIDGKLLDRLAEVGLVEPVRRSTLGDFLDAIIKQEQDRGDVSEATIKTWRQTRRNLLGYFGAEKGLHTITPADADAWAAWLKTDQKLGENSIRKRSQHARRLLRVAIRRKLITEDPFAGLVGTVVSTPERQHFIPREAVDALLDQCHGPEYRLLLVFARYMGVRIPSEIVPLKWSDVDWEKQRIVITSPKTKRHKGKGTRICPIFPEVLPFLQEAWEAAPEGAVYLFPSIRSAGKNLRTWLGKAIVRAGLTPWPRLWQNFRATRATELADRYPSHVAAAWLGHTEQIADAHYRQVTGDHYVNATAEPTGSMPAYGKQSEEAGPILAHSGPLAAHQGSNPNFVNPDSDEVCGILSYGENGARVGKGTRTPDFQNHNLAL